MGGGGYMVRSRETEMEKSKAGCQTFMGKTEVDEVFHVTPGEGRVGDNFPRFFSSCLV